MQILSRFKQIMAANINALLDKAEDPEKMIDQYLRQLNEDFAELKKETAGVMADEKAAKRKLDECEAEIEKMDLYVKKAIEAGNDADAKVFLSKGNGLRAEKEALLKNYEQCADASAKMRQMHDKLAADIQTLEQKKATLKAKLKAAETQEKMAKLGGSMNSAGNTMAAFEAMEDKINKMVDQADALSELTESAEDVSADALMEKYKEKAAEDDLDAQLAALKATMGVTVE